MMEFMDKGSLYDIVKLCIRLEEKIMAYVIQQILLALQFIHERRRVHRDIKVDNVLISSKGNVKLGSFGFF
jgi:serine/threonine protein kinase